MSVKVFLGRVRGGCVLPEAHAVLPEGLVVTVVADLPETGLVAVDPDDADLIRALHEEAWLGGRSRMS
jgi:hypothetical protein